MSLVAIYYKKGNIGTKGGYRAGFNEETFRGRPPRPPLLLCRALSRAYNSRVCE